MSGRPLRRRSARGEDVCEENDNACDEDDACDESSSGAFDGFRDAAGLRETFSSTELGALNGTELGALSRAELRLGTAGDRRAGRDGLDAALAAAAAPRAAALHADVPDLPGDAVGPANQAAVKHHGAAHAGGNRDEDEVRRAARAAAAVLAECCRVRVAVHAHLEAGGP